MSRCSSVATKIYLDLFQPSLLAFFLITRYWGNYLALSTAVDEYSHLRLYVKVCTSFKDACNLSFHRVKVPAAFRLIIQLLCLIGWSLCLLHYLSLPISTPWSFRRFSKASLNKFRTLRPHYVIMSINFSKLMNFIKQANLFDLTLMLLRLLTTQKPIHVAMTTLCTRWINFISRMIYVGLGWSWGLRLLVIFRYGWKGPISKLALI